MSAAAPPADGPPAARPRPTVRRKQGHGILYAVLAVVIVVLLVGIGAATSWYGLSKSSSPSTSTTACASGQTISGNGASFLETLMSQWVSSYNGATGNEIDYTAGAAGLGINALADKTTDFAATDEPLNDSEYASFDGATLLTLPVTGGAVTIVYNIPNWDHTLNITGPQLAEIYLGTINNWNSPVLAQNNSGLPNATIVTVHRSDPAGTSYVLTNLFQDDSAAWQESGVGVSIAPAWPKAATQEAEKGNSGLAKYVAATADTIGYVDLADAEANDLPLAGVLNPQDHFIVPNATNTQSSINDLSGQTLPSATGNWSKVSWVNAPGVDDYPLATLSYFLIYQNPAIGTPPSAELTQILIQWITWVVNDGQQYAHGLYYVTPPTNLLTQDLSALGSINWNGASIPACH